MEELIATLFLARDIAHREHLATRSYAQHMALGGFYTAIIEQADALAEAYQGKYGLLDGIPYLSPNGEPCYSQLKSQLEWIEANRYKAAAKTDTTIQNLIDAVCESYASTLYKLKFLA